MRADNYSRAGSPAACSSHLSGTPPTNWVIDRPDGSLPSRIARTRSGESRVRLTSRRT